MNDSSDPKNQKKGFGAFSSLASDISVDVPADTPVESEPQPAKSPSGSFYSQSPKISKNLTKVVGWILVMGALTYFRTYSTQHAAQDRAITQQRVEDAQSTANFQPSQPASNATPSQPGQQPGAFNAPTAPQSAEDAEKINQRGDHATALKILIPLAESGDARAQYDVGSMYLKGEGTQRDYVAAKEWFGKSALQGHPLAMLFLGVLSEKGAGTKQDNVAAYEWYYLATQSPWDDKEFHEAAAKMLTDVMHKMTAEQISLAKKQMSAANSMPQQAAAQCYSDGDTITIQGTATPQSFTLANGTVSVAWILTTQTPACIGSENNKVSRFQIIGSKPPEGDTIELTGKLSTGNFTQYYTESNAIKVISGRKISTDSAPPRNSEPSFVGQYQDQSDQEIKTSSAGAASFDCQRAKSTLELLICADTGLAALDGHVGQLYYQVLAAAKYISQKEMLKDEQRQFLKNRTDACAIPLKPDLSSQETQSLIECLKGIYITRVNALEAQQHVE